MRVTPPMLFCPFLGAFIDLQVTSFSAWTQSCVGASLLAMVVNDNACGLDKRGALESIAGKPAPTGIALAEFLDFQRGHGPV